MPELVTIISNGPSAQVLREHPRLIPEGLKIGVNKVAGWCVGLDWWCFTDHRAFLETIALSQPKIFTKRITAEKILGLKPAPLEAAAERFSTHWHSLAQDDVQIPVPWPEDFPPWNTYSGPAALGLAWHLGAMEIDIYGVDMWGPDDSAGEENIYRDMLRWQNEWRIWDTLVEAIQEDRPGIKISRRKIDGDGNVVELEPMALWRT